MEHDGERDVVEGGVVGRCAGFALDTSALPASNRDGSNLAGIATRYQAVNIKLDKTGGLTQALALARQARARNMVVVIGCMVSTSLSMAPTLLLSQFARFVDLDGPQLLARDRDPGLEYNGSRLSFSERVWG